MSSPLAAPAILRWAIVLSTVCPIVSAAASGWHAEGTPLDQSDRTEAHPVICGDGAGGAYIAWVDGPYTIRLQRVSPEGIPAPGWSGDGAFGPSGRFGEDPVLVADGRGGAFITWRSDHVINYSHVNPDGGFHVAESAATPLDLERGEKPSSVPGVSSRLRPAEVLKEDTSVWPNLVTDGPSGAAYLIWQYSYYTAGNVIRIGRLLPDGGQDPSFPWAFRMDTTSWTAQFTPVGCTDGAGGVIVAWMTGHSGTGYDIAAMRITRDGAVAMGWARTGNPVSRANGDQGAVGIASDGAGGAFIAWQDERVPGRQQVYAQRITADGVPAPGWGVDGVRVCQYPSTAGTMRVDFNRPVGYSSIASDGHGGMFIAWSDQRSDDGDIYCQHLLADGSVAPGWQSNGNPVGRAPGAQTHPTIAEDGTGGVLVSWEDRRGAYDMDIYATHVAGDGSVIPGWPDQGLSLCSQRRDQSVPHVTAGAGGGPIVAWQDGRCGPARIFASPAGANGALPDGMPLTAPWASWLGWDAVGTSLRVAWNVTGESGPVIVQRAERDGAWQTMGTVTPDIAGHTEFVDSTVIAMCPYHYRVLLSACGAMTFGEDSVDVPMDSGIPRPTAVLRSASAGAGVVSLAWDALARDSLIARVERAEACGNGWASIPSVRDGLGAISCRDSALLEGRRYAYRVALRACGHDEISSVHWVDVPPGEGFLRMRAEPRGAVVEHDTLHLTWNIATGLSTTVRVYRLDPGGDTLQIASRRLGSPSEIHVDDHGLFASSRVGYQVGLQWDAGVDCRGSEQRSDVMWVDVTEPAPRVALGLRVRGNPARDVPEISLALPTGDPAPLELFDAAGRLLWRTDVGALGPGVHSMALTAAESRAPGVYLLRLTQLGVRRSVRLAIIR